MVYASSEYAIQETWQWQTVVKSAVHFNTSGNKASSSNNPTKTNLEWSASAVKTNKSHIKEEYA